MSGQGASVMHDEMMEIQVLGGLMSGGTSAYEAVGPVLKASDFMLNEHGLIYGAMGALAAEEGADESGPFDVLLLRSQLLESGHLDAVGGLGMLQQLDGIVLAEATLTRYANRLKKMAFRRRSKETLYELIEATENPEMDEKKIRAKMKGHLEETDDAQVMDCGGTLGEYIDKHPDLLQYELGDKQEVGWWTGFHELDAVTKGLKPGKVVVIGGCPGDGKSALGINMAVNVSRINDVFTSIFTLEMGEQETMGRINTSLAEVSHDKVKNGMLSMFERKRVEEAHKQMKDMKLCLYKPHGLDLDGLEAYIRRDVRVHDTKVVFIDYLQLAARDTSQIENRQVAVGNVCVRLKQLAEQLNICIVELAQMNREQAKRETAEGKRPVRSDLRESGDVENNADVVCLIFRPERCAIKSMNRQDTKGKVILIVDKHRNGAMGDVNLVFKDSYRKFDNADGPGLVPPPEQMRWHKIPDEVARVMEADSASAGASGGSGEGQSGGSKVGRLKSKDALGVDGPSGVKVPDGVMREYKVRERYYYTGYV